MRALPAGLKPKRVIGDLSQVLPEHYDRRQFIDLYALYQHLMGY
jgi:hypothetical protein